MAKHKIGKGIYKKLKVGDSVLDTDGEDLSKRENTCVLDNKYAKRSKSGLIVFQGIDPLFDEPVDFYLSAEEWAALKEKF